MCARRKLDERCDMEHEVVGLQCEVGLENACIERLTCIGILEIAKGKEESQSHFIIRIQLSFPVLEVLGLHEL